MDTTITELKEAEHEQVWQTVEKAAPALQLSQQGLYSAIREQQLPPDAVLQIGRRIRVNLKKLLGNQTAQK